MQTNQALFIPCICYFHCINKLIQIYVEKISTIVYQEFWFCTLNTYIHTYTSHIDSHNNSPYFTILYVNFFFTYRNILATKELYSKRLTLEGIQNLQGILELPGFEQNCSKRVLKDWRKHGKASLLLKGRKMNTVSCPNRRHVPSIIFALFAPSGTLTISGVRIKDLGNSLTNELYVPNTIYKYLSK